MDRFLNKKQSLRCRKVKLKCAECEKSFSRTNSSLHLCVYPPPNNWAMCHLSQFVGDDTLLTISTCVMPHNDFVWAMNHSPHVSDVSSATIVDDDTCIHCEE